MPTSLHTSNHDVEPHERLMRALAAVGGPLAEADRKAIRHHVVGPIRKLSAREDVFREGDRTDMTVIVVNGLLCRYRILTNGGRQITSFHIPGDAPDVESLFLKKMDHNLATLDAATILQVPHDNMNAMFAAAPRVEKLFWHWTVIEASICREWIANIGRRNASSRIAHLLCETVTRLKAVGLSDGETCHLPITQTELADATGLSSVHANRSLQSLRRDGLISFRSGSLTVLDWAGLMKAADFDAAYLHIAPAE